MPDAAAPSPGPDPGPDPAPDPWTWPLGVHLTPTGADAAVLATSAERVEVCLLDDDGAGGLTERRVVLPQRRHGVWSGHLDGVRAGQRYGLRVHGPWDPGRGHRHDPAKLLLDPYAPAVTGQVRWGPEVFAHAVDAATWAPVPGPARGGGLDSAAHVPHGVVLDAPVADPAARPRTPWSRTVVYEAHLRGLTMRHPGVPEPLRGTWAGLAHPAVLDHLVALGVTAVELLPVQAASTEVHLARRGAVNYWGYSTLSWFAPEPRYATAAARAAGPTAVLAEVAAAVGALHAAGLEVLLDVVLNHSCEGPAGDGPSLSLRGLDAATYYRLDDSGRDVDATGCGNTLDFGSPRVVQLALDSLRHWVSAYGVDGFRFDLAPALARGRDGAFSPDHPFLVAAAADPVLADPKLIAEPWDLGPDGWRTGGFPAPWAEWNDRFRDGAREFWLAGAGRLSRGQAPGGDLRELAHRLSGSSDLFARGDRGPLASVSFVTAHDGLTLADTTAFEHKHNAANGEGGRDGSDGNRSWNHGVEGWTREQDPDGRLVEALRRRSVRDLLATLLLSAGVPMLTAGDELGRTQGGNNNPYCLDDETSWVDWRLAGWQEDLLATTRALVRLRREHAVLRPQLHPVGPQDGHPGAAAWSWFAADGAPMTVQRWEDPALRTVQVLLDGTGVGGDSLLLVLRGELDDGGVVLPRALPGVPGGPAGSPAAYRLLWDSAVERYPDGVVGAPDPAGAAVPVSALSVRVYRADPAAHPAADPAQGAGQTTVVPS